MTAIETILLMQRSVWRDSPAKALVKFELIPWVVVLACLKLGWVAPEFRTKTI